MMKKLLFIMLSVLLMGGCSGLRAKTQTNVYRVACAGVRNDCPIVIGNIPLWAQSAVVKTDGYEIPSQLDKPLNELVFVANVSGTRDFRVTYSSEPAKRTYPARVHAQMWLKNPDKTLQSVDTVASDKDDMYRKLHHHGPAFESEYAAYRIYFDKKQTIDTYGKKQPRLELAETNWYPSDEQMQKNYGYDNLRVFGSVGVGALKGWDAAKQAMTHISDFRRREARIVAKGPVRTIVEMQVDGWQYCGREISMTSRYILYAGHSDVQVENRIQGDHKGLVFTTGIMKMAGNKALKSDDAIAAFGCDFPENDTLKWERERVGLAIAVPQKQIVSQTDDAASYLFQLAPDVRGRIDYTFQMLWRRSEWLNGRTDDQCLVGMLDLVHKGQSPVTVSLIK